MSQRIDFGKSINSVFGSIKFSFKALAKVNGLKTEPNSYVPLVTLLIKFTSVIFCLLLGLKSGNEIIESIFPLLTFINIEALPLLLKIS